MKSPCKDCCGRFYDAENKITCHSSCEKYIAFRKKCEEINHKKLIEGIQWGYQAETSRRICKQKRINRR